MLITFEYLKRINTILLSPLTFDPSILQMHLPILTGGSLITTTMETVRDPVLLGELMRKTSANVLMITPRLFRSLSLADQALILAGKTGIRHLLLGGEPFPMQLFQFEKWKIGVWNIYGTTECSIWSTLHYVDFDRDRQRVPIGKPFEHSVVDLKPCEDESIYEIWIGGRRRVCYIDAEMQPKSMRFSGDLARKDSSGAIYYHGRKDFQIKRNGKRVDLGVLDNFVLEHGAFREVQ